MPRAGQRPWWNLRSKLIVSFSALIAAALILSQLMDIWGLPIIGTDGRAGYARNEAFSHLEMISDLKVNRLLHQIRERTTDIQVLFDNELTRNQIAALSREYDRAKQDGQPWKEWVHRSPSGQSVYQGLMETFHRIHEIIPAYTDFLLADPHNGDVMVAAHESAVGLNLFSEVEPQAAVSAYTPRVLPLENCSRTGTPALHIVYAIPGHAPVDGSDPSTLALLLIHLDPDEVVMPMMYLKEVVKDMETVVVDHQGRNVITLSSHDGTVEHAPLSYRVQAEPAMKAAAGESGRIEADDYRGIPVLAVYRSVPVTAEWNWGLVVKRDRASLLAPLRRDIAQTCILAIAIIVLSILLTFRLSNHLMQPVMSLGEVAERVAAGDLAARAKVLGSDQIGHLARQFNYMIDRVANWHKELDHQVRQRTEKLYQAEQQLRGALLFNEEIISGAGEGIIVYDSELRYRVWNQVMERLTGLSALEVIGRSAPEIFPHLIDTGILDLLRRALSGEVVTSPDVAYHVPRTGKSGWVSGTYAPHRGPDGRIVGVIGTVRDITDRKQAEAKLRQSEERFRQLAEHIDEVFWLIEPGAAKILYVSAAYETVWDRPAEALAQNPREWIETVLPEDRPRVLDALRSQALGQSTFEEYRIRRPDGSIRWIHDRGYPIHDERGRIYRVAGIAEDVTPQKLASAALEESEARFRLLSEHSLTGIYIIQDYRYQYVNPALCEILGRSHDELIMLNSMVEIVHPDEQPLVRERVRQRLEGEVEIARYTARYIRGDGRVIACEVVGRRIEYGGRPAIIGNLQDITEKQHAEAALAEGEAKYRGLFESMLDGFALHEIILNGDDQRPVDYRFLSVNPAFEQLTGLKAADVVGRRLMEILPDSEPHWIETYGHVAMTGKPARFEEFSQALNKHFEVYAFRPREGQFATVFQDITARKQAEAELARHQEHLEELVEERTAELKAVNRELESFSYSVSHDLRGPLRAVDGFSQALMDDCGAKLDPAAVDHLARIRGASQRMGQLIDDLLKLSRVTRAEMHRELLDLSTMAHEIAAELQASAPQRQVEFVIAPNLQAQGDTRLVRLALLNLLGNSWKFTGKHPRARIEFGFIQEPTRTVFFVRDDGAGFDMAYADKLFGAFQRLHRHSEFEGTGIGLATVQRVVHRHGGQVWAEGLVEGGATFYFTLP